MEGDPAEVPALGTVARGLELDLRAMLDAVADAVFLCDAQSGTVLDANRAGRELLGNRCAGAAEPSISDWSALEEGYGRQRALEALKRVAADGSAQLEWRAQRADGSRFWSELRLVRAASTPTASERFIAVLRDTSLERIVQSAPEPMPSVREADGVRTSANPARVPGSSSSLRDIGEVARARAELEASEARLRALVEASFEGIAIVHQGLVVDLNDQLAAMYGATREALLGRPQASFVAPESLEMVRSRIENRLDGAYEHLAQRPDGSIFPVEVRARSISLGGRVLRITAIRDMTERKRAEAERERLISELTARNAEMEQFAYTVSHDLKSPLITINGFLGALEQDLREGNHERVQSDVRRIRSASAKMSALLDDLLELSRVGRIAGALQRVEMTETAREAADLVAGLLDGARVELSIAADLPAVCGDRARLVQVLQNLFENAAKYMGSQPHPRVELGARSEGKDVVFSVRDNGIGIEPKYAERIFGLFEKLDQRSAGTGIGLALVRRIIEFHGGRVWVESDGHTGSTFLFCLPQAAGAPRGPEGTAQP